MANFTLTIVWLSYRDARKNARDDKALIYLTSDFTSVSGFGSNGGGSSLSEIQVGGGLAALGLRGKLHVLQFDKVVKGVYPK